METNEAQSAMQTLGKLFEGKSREERKRLLASLERAGAAVYRALAEEEPDASLREGLLLAAGREEENAILLEEHPG